MIGFRHADPRFPFLWETDAQPAGRWHGDGEGPVHYFADTPDGAWAEFVRHEEITSPLDLLTVRRSMWSVELADVEVAELPAPRMRRDVLTGDRDSYPECQAEARRVRRQGAAGLVAPSAALRGGEAAGWRVELGLRRASRRDGRVVILFGARADLVGWHAAADGRPDVELLDHVRHFGRSAGGT